MGLKRVRFRAPTVPQLPEVAKVERDQNGITLYTADADQVVRALVRADVPFQDLEVLPVSLEEAFLVLTGGAA